MAGPGTQQSGRKVINYNPFYVLLFIYYFSVTCMQFVHINMVLAHKEDFGYLFTRFLLFKYIFLMASAYFFQRCIFARAGNGFGPGYAVLCAEYFVAFTAYIYFLIIVKVCKANTVSEIPLDILSIITDLGEEMITRCEEAYIGTVVCTSLLIWPTTVLGPYMVMEMIKEYKNPTTIQIGTVKRVDRNPNLQVALPPLKGPGKKKKKNKGRWN